MGETRREKTPVFEIPAVLRQLGILKYCDKLSKLIDHRIPIPAGKEMEVEIRATTLWVTHLIREKLKLKYPSITPIRLNGIFWTQGQNNFLDKPYHLTRTIFY